MPVAVFAVGCGFGTEKYSTATLSNMLTISLGVAVASYGERKAVGWPVGVCMCPLEIWGGGCLHALRGWRSRHTVSAGRGGVGAGARGVWGWAHACML